MIYFHYCPGKLALNSLYVSAVAAYGLEIDGFNIKGSPP